MKLDILAFAAHPDDVELSASGTLIRHIEMGYKAGIIDLTRGELGTRGTPELRDQESAASSEYMGLSARENLGFRDGFFEHDEEHLMAVIRMIRKYRPEILLCNSVSDRHPDHGKGGRLVAEAAFLSGLIKIEDGLEPWRPAAVYHYIQDYYHKPDFVVDITGHMDRKLETIMCFKSQFYNAGSDEPETPISSKAFMEFIKARAREMGRASGFEFAEGFIAARTPGVSDLFNLK